MSTTTTDLDGLRRAVGERTDEQQQRWLDETLAAVRADASAIRGRFPAVGRKVGRGPLEPGADPSDLFTWTVDDAARTLLLAELGDEVGAEFEDLYRHGDAAERRAVLRALPFLPLGDAAVDLVLDAVRTNDLRLIAAALGPYAIEHLDDDALNQAALKCVFVGIPLDRIDGLDRRATPELSRMLADYAHERVAAGRTVPSDIWPFVDRYPPQEQLSRITAELEHPVEERRNAARTALADREATRNA